MQDPLLLHAPRKHVALEHCALQLPAGEYPSAHMLQGAEPFVVQPELQAQKPAGPQLPCPQSASKQYRLHAPTESALGAGYQPGEQTQ